MYGYIYKTTNIHNGKIYIGQKKSTKFLASRYLGSGKILKEAISLYGRDSFNIEQIDTAENQEELDAKEIYWISKLHATNRNIGYNISEGGNTVMYVWTDELKYKRSEMYKGIKNPNYGKKHTDETKKLMSINNPMTDPVKKKKMIDAHRTKEYREKISNMFKNRTFSEETINKMRESAIKRDTEINKKISKTLSKTVYQFSLDFKLIAEYQNALIAVKQFGIKSPDGIYDCCNNKRKTYKNFIWSYKKELFYENN